jgi:hypothetical protein
MDMWFVLGSKGLLDLGETDYLVLLTLLEDLKEMLRVWEASDYSEVEHCGLRLREDQKWLMVKCESDLWCAKDPDCWQSQSGDW